MMYIPHALLTIIRVVHEAKIQGVILNFRRNSNIPEPSLCHVVIVGK
jgi:hypothetical protein